MKESETKKIIDQLFQAGQDHILEYWNELTEDSQRKLLNQVKTIDFDLISLFKRKIFQYQKEDSFHEELIPPEIIPIPKTPGQIQAAKEAYLIGEELIRAGKVCVFLVAGGQGTRLGFDGPKGCYPIGPISGRSLFQMHAEKILASERFYGVTIPWYIMTSETNDLATKKFFNDHDYFGLKKQNILFFCQQMIPALNEKGKLILEAKDHIFTSPNGHGGSFSALIQSGAIEDMEKRGIETISYFQVDNVLIKIIDPLFVGYHIQNNAEMSSKMVRKTDPMEKVGHFGVIDEKLRVIEYSDMSEGDKMARNPDGSLKYAAGSIAIHLINPEFVKKFVTHKIKFPFHMAHKKIPYLNNDGVLEQPGKPNGYKFEMFIFNALAYTDNSIIMEIKREDEFSPVKNREGQNSPETAKQDVSNFFGGWLEASGFHVPCQENGDTQFYIEINPLFALNQEECSRKIPQDLLIKDSIYLEPE